MPRKRTRHPRPQLTAKRERFVQEYLLDLNASQAAIRAGYSIKTAGAIGHEILKIPEVAAAIAAVQAQRSAKFSIGLDNVLIELARLAFSNMEDFTRRTPDGELVADFSKATRAQMAAVQEITSEVYLEGSGEEAERVKRTKFKLADKRGPLTDLCKHLGGFIERFAAVNPDGSPIEPDASDNDLPRRIAFLLSQGLRARTVLSEKDSTTH